MVSALLFCFLWGGINETLVNGDTVNSAQSFLAINLRQTSLLGTERRPGIGGLYDGCRMRKRQFFYVGDVLW